MDLKLYRCAKCNKPKVVKPGDYCLSCSMKWEMLPYEYIIVNQPEFEEEVLEKTGWDRTYVQDRARDALNRKCAYVVFRYKNIWMDITIHEMFWIPRVMEIVLTRIQEEEVE